MIEKQIKDVIYENRKKKQLTQEQLADQLNVSNKTISKWERGLGYPDILILPTLAKVLDISVNELLSTDDLKPESIEQYDYKIMTKYKLNIIFAFFILIFSPVLYIISAFVFQSYKLSIISIFIGVIVALFSLITVILHSIQMYDFIRNKYTNEKYIRIFKNYLGLFSMILFVLSLFLTLLIENKIFSITVATLIYLLFLAAILIICLKLRVRIFKTMGLILFILSSILFISGIITMSILGIIPYILFYVGSQILNYIVFFDLLLISSNIFFLNSSIFIVPISPLSLERTATRLFSTSFAPTTSM